MKTYENNVKVVNYVCTKIVCDSCGREAEYPKDELWDTSYGVARTILEFSEWLDGDKLADEHVDLCPTCCEQLITNIRLPRLNNATVEEQQSGGSYLVIEGSRVAIMTHARAKGIAAALNTPEGWAAFLKARNQ